METIIINIDPDDVDENSIIKAARLIREGQVVAFPTETVYGLGANALDVAAVRRIFEAKGRPSDNPLIVHIDDYDMLKMVVRDVPVKARMLMERFWPGPLTIIMKKSPLIPSQVTAGLDTVGVRMPANEVALSLIRYAQVPIAAPSANLSGKPSPTRPEHVIHDMKGRIAAILSAGPCAVGLESTVVDVTGDKPKMFRPGGVTLEMLENTIGEVEVAQGILKPVDVKGAVPSPGMKYIHYSPEARVIVVDGDLSNVVERIKCEAQHFSQQGYRVGIMATEQTKDMYEGYIVIVLGDRQRPQTIASGLFAALRRFDELGVQVVLAEAIDAHGLGLAIMNRMNRAAGFDIIHA